ncbi:hypothetical protein F5148DRAFT_1337167 [Russula earlei]|uniref:Uncharacterized protein n=1 Tax=Russula earlei TaxID=71964 RepID=A0ACC0TVP5_9AGAM|nr:hypothetical protein F5148DRAFT_1337167 [Russula earlei]
MQLRCCGLPMYRLKLPISLNYHAGGVKVEDNASWVGLGWALNAGGSVIRNQRGLPDEGGYMDASQWVNHFPSMGLEQKYGYYNGTQTDLFNVSMGGESLQFFYDSTGRILTKPLSAAKIYYDFFDGKKGWKIVNTQGVQYYFLDAEESQSQPISIPDGASDISASVIISPEGKDSINFEYEQELQTFYSGYTLTPKTIRFKNGTVDFSKHTTQRDDLTDSTTDIQHINLHTSYINATTTHLYGDNTVNKRLYLDSVTVSGTGHTNPLSYGFDYYNRALLPDKASIDQDLWGYYNAAGNTGLYNKPPSCFYYTTAGGLDPYYGADHNPHPAATAFGTLNRMHYPTGGYTDFEYENNTVNNFAALISLNAPYYNGMDLLDTAIHFQLTGDAFGTTYYSATFTVSSSFGSSTGKALGNITIGGLPGSNTTPPTPLGPNDPVIQLTYPDASVHQLAQSGYAALPVGTYTLTADFTGVDDPDPTVISNFYVSIDYEYGVLNNTNKNKHVTWGGLRVKSIKNYDATGQLATGKLYEYEDSTGVSGGHSEFFPVLFNNNAGFCIAKTTCDTVSAIAMTPDFVLSTGSPVGYSKAQDPGNQYIFPYPPSNSYDEKRGLLLKQQSFKKNGAGYSLLTEKSSNYGWADSGVIATGVKFGQFVSGGCLQGNWCLWRSYKAGFYNTETEWIKLLSDTTRTYDDNGTAMATITRYEYSPNSLQRNKTTTAASNGDTVVTTVKYPGDYAIPAGTYANTRIQGIQKLLADNKVQEPVESAEYRNVNNTGLQLAKAVYASFKADISKADTLFAIENTSLLSDFQASTYTASSLQTDSRYTPRVIFNTYTPEGNIRQQQLANDVTEVYLWGYHSEYPVAKIVGSDYATVSALVSQSTLDNPATDDNTMRTTLNAIRTGLASSNAQAQNTPASTGSVPTISSSAVHTAPGAYGSGTINYVRSWTPQQPYSQDSDVTSGARQVTQVNKATQYIDGLGRPLQTVSWQASPAQKDMVSATVYDSIGREAYKYLPYTTTTTTGAFHTDPFTEQNSFYSSTYPGQQPAYTVFEPSPLNRPLQTLAPGNSWGGSGRGVGTSYELNTSGEVLLWRYTVDSIGAIPTTAASYAAGQLYRTVTTDEQGHRVVEYKDKDGQVVLKKVELPTSANPSPVLTSHAGWSCTYYVYDNLGSLRAVLPPKATEQLLSNSNTITTTVFKELCYSYGYDGRRRTIVKQVPGAALVFLVYDSRNRVVYTQDGNMRSKNWWLASLYDNLNRPIETAMLTGYSGTRASLQVYVSSLADNTTIDTAKGTQVNSVPVDLVMNTAEANRTAYEASHSVVLRSGFHFKATLTDTTVARIIAPASATSFSSPMPVNQNPTPPGDTLVALTLTYYDDYTQTAKTYTSSYNSNLGQGNNPYAETPPGSASTQTKGLTTVTRVRVIENANDLTQGQWLEAASFYDAKARTVQIQGTNYKGGLDILTSRYDFTGKVVSSYTVHNNAAGNTSNLRTNTTTDYDPAGRLLRVSKTLNDDALTTRIIIERNSYDAMGQLLNKQTGQKNSHDTTAMESDDYRYTIRGWLKGVNWNYSNSAPSSPTGGIANATGAGKWFAMDLSYDWGYTHNQYTGNIAGMRWQAGGDQAERSYGYGYDAANRLLYGDFNQRFGTSWSKTDPGGNLNIDFSMQMGNGTDAATAYDANGNILAMKQVGLQLNSSHTIDSLSYQYNSSSNKLSSVTDGITADNKLGDFTDKNTSGDDYGYDINGNMITDKNKRLNGSTGVDQTTGGAIVYNYLNLPWQISVQDDGGNYKGTISYIYDATGNKLEKRVKEKGTNGDTLINTTDYLGSYVYTNNILQFFGHEEGRIRKSKDTTQGFVYDYFLKDHLGNTRAVLTEEQTMDIYPAATLEDGSLAVDTFYYNIQSGNIRDISLIPGYSTASGVPYTNNNGIYNPDPGITTTNESQKIGQTPNNGYPVTNALLSFLNAFTGTGAVTAGSHAVTGSTLNSSPLTTDGLTAWLNDSIPTVTGKPKAYINWILFDDQFTPVSSGSGFSAVNSNPDIINTHTATTNITKNGYLYVVHSRGPLAEETHYYPFGLTMAGISSRAAGSLENLYKFNKGSELQHEEFSDGSGLELYATEYRSLDPQIGRWWQIDPKPSEAESPFSAMGNNPISNNDALGDTTNPAQFRETLRAYEARKEAEKDGDQTGILRNSTQQQYKDHPVQAFLNDVNHTAWALLGVDAIDNFIANRLDGRNSPKEVVADVVVVGLATTRGDGEMGGSESSGGTVRSTNKLLPDPEATGDHTTFERDNNGNIYKYQEWNTNERNPSGFDGGKRFDGGGKNGEPGAPHFNKVTRTSTPTPHMNDPATPGKVRGPDFNEFPNNPRFNPNSN